MRESDIVYENGDFWVRADRKQSAYVVYRSGITHSVSDSGYSLNDDGLSIAKARVDYLAKRCTQYRTSKRRGDDHGIQSNG